MKTKQRVQLLQRHRDARTLGDLSELLFPHSPIEVSYDFTLFGTDKVYEWHVYIEGQWAAKEKNLLGLAFRLYEIIQSQGDDWGSVPLRIVPDWANWPKITAVDLAAMSVMCDDLRAQDPKYYADE